MSEEKAGIDGDPEEPLEFGQLLRRFRLRAGLTQEKLALKVFGNTRKSSIGELENDLKRVPQPSTIKRLAEAFELTNEERSTLATAADRRRLRAIANRSAAPPRASVVQPLPDQMTDDNNDTTHSVQLTATTEADKLPANPVVQETPQRRRRIIGRRTWVMTGSLAVILVVGVAIAMLRREDLVTVSSAAQQEQAPVTRGLSLDPVRAASASDSSTELPRPAPPSITETLTGHPKWMLANHLTATKHEISYSYGELGDVPVVGNWDGDRDDDAAVYRPTAGDFVFFGPGAPPGIHLPSSQAEDWPIAGDWDGDGRDDIGLFRPANNTFYLISVDSGETISELTYGSPDDRPLVGDWDGDGRDDIGVYRTDEQMFDRRSSTGHPLAPIIFGERYDIPLAGNWEGVGHDEIGVYRPSTRTFRLAADDGTELAHIGYGTSEIKPIPLVGDWDGDGRDTHGVVQ